MSTLYCDACIVVTGGSGFIGSHLVDSLLTSGAREVRIVDEVEPRYAPRDVRVVFTRADVRDEAAMSRIVQDADFVFHHAAIASVPECSSRPSDAYDVNARGVATTLNAIRAAAPKARFILASSAAVYGNSLDPTKSQEDVLRNPHSIYGSSKAVAEDIALMYRRVYGVDISIVRYANVYGPRQPRYIVYDMFHKVQSASQNLEVLGSGLQQRDFVYIDDAVRMTLAAGLRANETHGPFNIGTGHPTTVLDVARNVALVMGRPDLALATTGSSWLGDVDYLLVDVTRSNREIGRTEVSFRDGLKATIAWFLEHDSVTSV